MSELNKLWRLHINPEVPSPRLVCSLRLNFFFFLEEDVKKKDKKKKKKQTS